MSSGTDEATLPPITDVRAGRLWQLVDEHAQVDGRCPVCGTRRRCWVRAQARALLILSGRPPARPA